MAQRQAAAGGSVAGSGLEVGREAQEPCRLAAPAPQEAHARGASHLTGASKRWLLWACVQMGLVAREHWAKVGPQGANR